MAELHLRKGMAAADGDPVMITPRRAGWNFTALRVIEVLSGGERVVETGSQEMAVLPLAGGCVVECDGERFDIEGRADVFERVTDFAYLPRDCEVRISSERGGRFALPAAEARRRLRPAYGAAEDVPVEIRGAGPASRQINNFLAPDAFEADRLCAVEVLTPEGNWSSYPPHKHDEFRDGEVALEEIYYFETARVEPNGRRAVGAGFGLQRLYTADGSIDLTESVAHMDVVLIPRGYHGPSVAAPGYDLYYLNVLAGRGEDRSMAFRDDPAHHWVRAAWDGIDQDPRLPLTSARGTRMEKGR